MFAAQSLSIALCISLISSGTTHAARTGGFYRTDEARKVMDAGHKHMKRYCRNILLSKLIPPPQLTLPEITCAYGTCDATSYRILKELKQTAGVDLNHTRVLLITYTVPWDFHVVVEYRKHILDISNIPKQFDEWRQPRAYRRQVELSPIRKYFQHRRPEFKDSKIRVISGAEYFGHFYDPMDGSRKVGFASFFEGLENHYYNRDGTYLRRLPRFYEMDPTDVQKYPTMPLVDFLRGIGLDTSGYENLPLRIF